MRWITAVAATLLAGCQGSFGDAVPAHRGSGEGPRTSPVPACPVDPDCAIVGNCHIYECPDYWLCEDLAGGGKRCTSPGPDYPDNSHEWQCEDVGGTTVCRGRDFPDGGGDGEWNCERQAEFVVCTDTTPEYPDGHGDGPWNCWFENEFRVCESRPGSPGGPGDGGGWTCYDTTAGRECRQDRPDYPDDREWSCYDAGGVTVCTGRGEVPDDGGGPGWDCESMGEFVVCRDNTPDYPDEGGDTPWDCWFAGEFRVCSRPDSPDGPGEPGTPPSTPPSTPPGEGGVCVPGVQRWCDDHIYCSWGKQTCLPDGRWGPCIEPTVTRDGLIDRPATECGCRYFYFNEDCCEDQMDRDRDGHADCIIPADHRPPACPSDGSLCSYCDVARDCDSGACLFARDGYAFCGQDCSTGGCPSGFTCATITTSSGRLQQCVPTSGRCE
ncbi:MAG: hypothetical protein NZ898_14025 [Myxococcota bacterium]|nr:hypothetical protein [Myxococcota bacterium]MDW8363891.1 hypothetical protein [Myxococcales bacterium]